MTIRLLDERTINKIAAGEVVERPASVIKEIVENSLDAGARRIEIRLAATEYTVVDDGRGMSAADLRLAVQRHATSKIQTAEDLGSLVTYGFRGEALPSIAAVSELTIRSRPAGEAVGYYLALAAGDIRGEGRVAMPAGTAVEVRRLFHNTPVRAKFLRSERTEQRRMFDAVERLALGRPDVAFRCTFEGRLILATPGTGDHREALLAASGVDLARQIEAARHEAGPLSVVALVGSPATARADRRGQGVWINSRPVYVPGMLEAAMAVYPHGLVPLRRFPLLYLFLTVPSAEVDANVHPTKAQVRLAGESEIISAVVRCMRTLGSEDDRRGEEQRGRPPTGPAWEPFPSAGRTAVASADGTSSAFPEVAAAADELALAGPDHLAVREGQPDHYLWPAMLSQLRPLGQSANRWVICDGPGGVYLVDQHAAHERVLFERLGSASEYSSDTQPSQLLAVPQPVELDAHDFSVWEAATGDLLAAGLGTEAFGGQSVVLRSVPAALARPGFDAAAFLRDVLGALAAENTRHSALAPHLRARRAVASCAAAVKAHQPLSGSELSALLADLASCHSPLRCPHGRPTVVRISHDELARRFGRT